MLSLHALLFFILGTSVFAHPVPSPLFRLTKRLNPSVAQELQKLLEKQSFAGRSTWIRTMQTELDKKCDDVITFDPAKLPRISTLLGEPGKLSEGKDVEGNLKQVLEKIKGSWILRPDSTNADHRTSEMTIDPDDQGKPIEIGRPNVETEEWKKTEEHNYPGPLSEHVAGWWYRRPPMVSQISYVRWQPDNKNDVIHIFPDGQIEWFQLDAKGEISKIERHIEKDRLLGNWARMQHANKDPSDLLDELIVATENDILRLSAYGPKEA